MSSFLGVDPRAMMGTVGGMFAGFATVYGIEAIGHRIYPVPPGLDASNAELFRAYVATLPTGAFLVVAGAWLAGVAVAVGIANRFSDGDPRPALFAGGFLYLSTLATLFTIPHPVWMMAVGGLGVPLVATLVWWFTRIRWDDE